VDSASDEQMRVLMANLAAANPSAIVVRAASPVSLADGPSIAVKEVLVVEDGPTITHGGLPSGAGTVAARQGGAREQVDPRPWAVGSIAETLRRYPHIGPVLPAMGYSEPQLRELEATIDAIDCDVVIAGTPVDLGRLVQCRHAIRQATYELVELGEPMLGQVLEPTIARARSS
jgi:predicted GTPase